MLEGQITTRDETMNQLRIINEKNLSNLQAQFMAKEQTLKEQKQKLEIYDEENRKLNEANLQIHDEKRKLEIQLRIHQKNLEELETQLAANIPKLEKKEQEIDRLKFQLGEQKQESERLAFKLMELKSQLDCLQLQLRRFSVKKIGKLLPKSDAEIILSKNPSNGLLMIDVVVNGKHHIHLLSSIVQVQPDQKEPKRLYIDFTNEETEAFESEERDELLESIRDFMRIYEEDNPATGNATKDGGAAILAASSGAPASKPNRKNRQT